MRKFSIISLLFTIIFFVSFSTSFGQKNREDVVFLKDGSIIRGKIIEYMTNTHVKIETRDNSIWVFKHNKIDKIAFDKGKTNNGPSNLKTGYYNLTDMGVLIGTGNNNNSAPFSIMMVNGYRFNPHISSGLGVGIEFFSTPVIPLYIDTRYDFYDRSISPFAYLKGGYSFQVGENNSYYYEKISSKGGLMFGVGVGIRVSLGEKSQLIAGLGYRFQKLDYSYYDEWTDDDINRMEKFNRLAIRVGFVFN